MIVTPTVKKAISAGALLLLTAFAVLNVDEQLQNVVRSPKKAGRSLAVDLGNGDCQYEPPSPDVDPSLDLHKYLLAGFPSGDKRMTYVQMETLTGLPSKDDWDFVFNGFTNAPFIKTNYPHPAGVWSWGSEANEVALIVQFIRRDMVEYADIVWYQNDSPSYENERFRVERKYGERRPTEEWYRWRDEKVLANIYRYGHYIDYWMENGERRDPISHQPIDQALWDVMTHPQPVKKIEEVHVCHKTSSPTNRGVDMVVSPSDANVMIEHGDFLGICNDAKLDTAWWEAQPPKYEMKRDDNCARISGSCRPQIVISPDKMRDPVQGPAETAAIANRLKKKNSQYVVSETVWNCIWTKLIEENQGPMTFEDRKLADEPSFSAFMLGEMVYELDRMIKKYSATVWTSSNPQAVRLVSLFNEHKAYLVAEINAINSGARTLKVSDFLGPKSQIVDLDYLLED